MTLIFCIDEERGIAFGGRRQSRDRELYKDIISDAANKQITMSAYSAKLFDSGNIYVSDTPTQEDDIYFLELKNPKDIIPLANRVVVYNWNRLYPSDVKFDAEMSSLGFSLVEKQDIKGFSHEKITKEIYEKQ